MALEVLAWLRAVHGSTVLYPADATATAKLVAAMADRGGVSFLRTTRGAYPVLYASDEDFPIGGSKVLRRSADDRVALIGAALTAHQCLAAAAAPPRRRLPAAGRRPYPVHAARADPPARAGGDTRGGGAEAR